MVPLRGVEYGFAFAEKITEPLLEPFAPAVTVIHGAWLTAVQLQFAPATTAKVPPPPLAATFVVGGKTE